MSELIRGPRNSHLLKSTIGLAEYLRDLVRSARSPVRDISKLTDIVWLGDVVDHAPVASGRDDADEFTGVLALHYVSQEPAPRAPGGLRDRLDPAQVNDPSGPEPHLRPAAGESGAPARETQDAFEAWISEWRAWAERRRDVAPVQELHERLTRFARTTAEQDDAFEVVLAIGLVTWKTADGKEIFRHLVTRSARITVDKAARIIVALDPDSALRLEDREFLSEEQEYRHDRVSGVHDRIAESPQHPLAPAVAGLIEEWADLALDFPVRYSAEWQVPQEDADSAAEDRKASSSKGSSSTGAVDNEPTACIVTLAPAIILRPRNTNAVADVYDRIIADLNRPEARVPLGLAQLVAPLEAHERAGWNRSPRRWPLAELRDDPLFPLPTNAEQRAVLDRLGPNTAVVVQGPPGTGKTHTIANLTAALVAQGQRVLVTSQKDQALSVLRDLIPAPVRDMCVLLATGDRTIGPSALERTLTALSERAATMDADRLDEQTHDLRRRYHALLRRRDQLQEEIRVLRVVEATVHRPAPGYQGTLVELDRAVARNRARHGWMPQPPAGCPGELPLGAGQFGRLRDLLRTVELDQYGRRDQWFPDPQAVLAPEVFARLLSRIDARAGASGPLSPAGERIARLSVPSLTKIQRLVAGADTCLNQIGLDPRARRRPAGDWRPKAISDTLAGRNTRIWQRLADTLATVEHSLAAVDYLGSVTLPSNLSAEELAEFLGAARDWRAHLRDGGRPRSWFPAGAQSRVRPLLARCSVEGVTPDPTSETHLSTIVSMLEITTTANEIDALWRSAQVPAVSGDLTYRLERYAERARGLAQVSRFAAVLEQLERELLGHEVRVHLNSMDSWDAFTAAISTARERIHLEADVRARDALAAALTAPQGSAPAPEAEALHAAVHARNPAAYSAAYQDYATAAREYEDVVQMSALGHELHAVHRALARSLADDPHNQRWDDLSGVARAWAWAVAARYADSVRAGGREHELDDELGVVQARLLATTGELAGAEGWRRCLGRLDRRQRQALAQLRSHLTAVGTGDGRYAARARAAARDAMTVARGAVPVWIMPLYQVVDTLPAEPDSFDVVIVDEASQVGLDGLFLLWLAPRVIVVGDDKQCVPSFGGGEHQRFYDHLDEYLAEIARSDRDMFKPGMNLYELLSARFPDTVRLTEHFRSMPEIIGWSSRQFYRETLTPLRQFGADRLEPLRVEYVDGAYQEGREERIRNPAEAKQIVAKVVELLRDPRYDRRSFGIITLQGTAQAPLIEQLIAQSVDAPTRLKHRIRVGRPADFQGDERDVILLSMVAVTPAKMLRSLNDQRRFNVAATRARDQMWLFSSVRPDRLKSEDLRFSLLTYMSTPLPATVRMMVPDLAEVTGEREHPAFDSLFEQRVFRRIRERGYVVAPQISVGAKRIDLVVYGETTQLAVECDGDSWHDSVEQQRQDIHRERELIRAGWKFWRIRESAFVRDPDEALSSLWTTLAARGITPGAQPPHAPVPALLPDVPAESWQPIDLPAEDDPDPAGGENR